MPELPDVERMRRYLQATALHQEIADVHVRSDELVEDTSADQAKERLIGRSFEETQRHGKYLFVALNDQGEGFLVLHFGMTGGLKYFKDANEEPTYDRVHFHFANGYQLVYYSMRKLGHVEVIDDAEKFIDERNLGPDALAPDFGLAEFREAMEGRRAMVKAVLMDQESMAGIGNVYADEILFQGGVHPQARASSLDHETLEELFHTVKMVLERAIRHQAQPDQFPDTFLTPHRHDGGTCPRCRTELERVKVYGRTSYFCPNHQKRNPARSV